MSQWPKQDYASMVKFYGPVGENQIQIQLPYEMVLAWEPTVVKRITCHEKVAQTMVKIFTNLLGEYGYDKIHELGIDRFGGMLNVRKMRGGSSWSIHSWGAACDLNPEKNQLKQNHTTARFAKPEYKPMWKIILAEGATSLGLSRDYDWMHFQLADL
jgi:hypothetical protein